MRRCGQIRVQRFKESTKWILTGTWNRRRRSCTAQGVSLAQTGGTKGVQGLRKVHRKTQSKERRSCLKSYIQRQQPRQGDNLAGTSVRRCRHLIITEEKFISHTAIKSSINVFSHITLATTILQQLFFPIRSFTSEFSGWQQLSCHINSLFS